MKSSIADIFFFIKLSFKQNKSRVLYLFYILLFLCIIVIGIRYFSNYLSGKLTDYLVAKNMQMSINIIIIISLAHIIFSSIIAIKDYIFRKVNIIIHTNLYYNIGADVLDDTKCDFSCQRMSGELNCFSNSFLRLITDFIQSAFSFPMFIFVLYEVGGYKMIIFALLYSIFGQIISAYLANLSYHSAYQMRNANSDLFRQLVDQARKPTGEKRFLPDMSTVFNESMNFYKQERLLELFRNSFNDLKDYLPYIVLLMPYLNGTITLGDTVRAISAFRYVMQSIGFFTNNRMNILQFDMSIKRLKELINF